MGIVESVRAVMWARKRQPDQVAYGVALGHERFGPRELLDQAVAAERAGFDLKIFTGEVTAWSSRYPPVPVQDATGGGRNLGNRGHGQPASEPTPVRSRTVGGRRERATGRNTPGGRGEISRFGCPRSESPGTYMSAITGELIRGVKPTHDLAPAGRREPAEKGDAS
jgi:hypothetical protein